MLKHFPLNFDLEDEALMQDLAAGFERISTSRSAITGVVGAIDGIAIRIPCLSLRDCDDPIHYLNRKEFFSINCQAICDADLKFRWAAMTCAGSTHDAMAFKDTQLYRLIQSGALRHPYCIFGDAAYVCDDCAVTPYASTHAQPGTPEDVFNFFHSNLRICVECAFGVLVARCACLLLVLSCIVALYCIVVHCILVCMVALYSLDARKIKLIPPLPKVGAPLAGNPRPPRECQRPCLDVHGLPQHLPRSPN